MSPTRRQFLYAFGAGSAGAMVYAARLPFGDANLVVQANLDQNQRPWGKVQFVDNHGLPPTTRAENVRCLECGNPLGQLLVDEMQSFKGFNGYACGDCFKSKVGEIEDMANEKDDQKEEEFHNESLREDLEADLEEARTDLRELQRKHKAVESIAERMRWQLTDLRTAPFPPIRQIERMEEALDAFIKGA